MEFEIDFSDVDFSSYEITGGEDLSFAPEVTQRERILTPTLPQAPSFHEMKLADKGVKTGGIGTKYFTGSNIYQDDNLHEYDVTPQMPLHHLTSIAEPSCLGYDLQYSSLTSERQYVRGDVPDTEHHGQLKLLVHEMAFVNATKDVSGIYVYAGGSPGNHIALLKAAFPWMELLVIDPRPLAGHINGWFRRAQQVEDIKFGPTRVPNYMPSYMSVGLAKRLRSYFDTRVIYFISDIRTDGSLDVDYGSRPSATDISADMELQLDCAKALDAYASLMKFAAPFTGGDLLYCGGTLYLQPFSGPVSTEMRLVALRPQLDELVSYDISQIERRLFHHNTEVRSLGGRESKDSPDFATVARLCMCLPALPRAILYMTMKARKIKTIPLSISGNEKDGYTLITSMDFIEVFSLRNPTHNKGWSYCCALSTTPIPGLKFLDWVLITGSEMLGIGRVAKTSYEVSIVDIKHIGPLSDLAAKEKNVFSQLIWERFQIAPTTITAILHSTGYNEDMLSKALAMKLGAAKRRPDAVIDPGFNAKGLIREIFAQEQRVTRLGMGDPELTLDYGCGDLKKKTNQIELLYGLTHCCDIDDVGQLIFTTPTNRTVAPGLYYTIFCIHVLHHCVDKSTALLNMYNLLQPGGRIIIVDHDYSTQQIRRRVDFIHALYDLTSAPHLRGIYSPVKMRHLVNIVACALPPSAVIQRILKLGTLLAEILIFIDKPLI